MIVPWLQEWAVLEREAAVIAKARAELEAERSEVGVLYAAPSHMRACEPLYAAPSHMTVCEP
jgi:hypothetical protein